MLAFDPTPSFTIESLSTQTNVPTATLRIWERHYGILSVWSSENELYSARDIAAVQWIRAQVLSEMSVKQAIIELIHLEPDYAGAKTTTASDSRYAVPVDSYLYEMLVVNRVIKNAHT